MQCVPCVASGEENAYCQALIEAHKACLRMEGFNVSQDPGVQTHLACSMTASRAAPHQQYCHQQEVEELQDCSAALPVAQLC